MRIRNFLGHTGDIANKTKLFDAGVLEEGKQLGPNIVSVLVDYHEKMERTLFEMRYIMTQTGHVLEPKTVKATTKVKEEKTPSKATASRTLPISAELKSKNAGEEKTPGKSKLKIEAATGKGLSPESQNRIQGKSVGQEMPQSTLSGRSPMPTSTKKKTPAKRSREKTPPIKIESEEDKSLENSMEEGNQTGSEEVSEEEESKPEPDLPTKKGKGQTPSKGKATPSAKASASRKHPAKSGATKSGEVAEKRLKKV